MSERRRGLGRGLGALIPGTPGRPEPEEFWRVLDGRSPQREGWRLPAEETEAEIEAETTPEAAAQQVNRTPDSVAGDDEGSPEPAPTPGESVPSGAYYAELPLDALRPNPRQPRTVFAPEELEELVRSIREVGLLQPVVVRRIDDDAYELVMGERRWRAARAAGLPSIPAIVRQTEDQRLLLDALLENLHRTQLNPLEEAAAFDQLIRDFACTHDELADRVGKSRSAVSNTLRLLRLSPAVQRRLAAGVLSSGHARALLMLEDEVEQDRLAHRIVAEGLSVRTVEEIVAGGTRARPRRPRAGRLLAPALDDLAARLSDRWDTRVKVTLGQRKGRLTVDFASVDDLERIIAAMAPGEGQLFTRADPETAMVTG